MGILTVATGTDIYVSLVVREWVLDNEAGLRRELRRDRTEIRCLRNNAQVPFMIRLFAIELLHTDPELLYVTDPEVQVIGHDHSPSWRIRVQFDWFGLIHVLKQWSSLFHRRLLAVRTIDMDFVGHGVERFSPFHFMFDEVAGAMHAHIILTVLAFQHLIEIPETDRT